MLARNCSFSKVILLPQPSQVKCEWLRKYPIGFDCPVPQVPQTISIFTFSTEFFSMSKCIPVIRRFGL